MRCRECGQFSDWIGETSRWNAVTEHVAHSLYECHVCGNTQHAHG